MGHLDFVKKSAKPFQIYGSRRNKSRIFGAGAAAARGTAGRKTAPEEAPAPAMGYGALGGLFVIGGTL